MTSVRAHQSLISNSSVSYRHNFAISPRLRASFAGNVPPSNQRAQGMPGARSARSRAWCVVNTRVSHHGHAGITRHSPRNGFNGFLRALPGDRACLPPSSAKIAFRELDASVGASGPHDFAVRKSAPSSLAPLASTASRLASVTIASRPSVRRDGDGYRVDLGGTGTGIFFGIELDRANRIEIVKQFAVLRHKSAG
jgi:hypothetical protein